MLPAGKVWPEYGFSAGIASDADDKWLAAWAGRAKALAFASITVAEKVRRDAPSTVIPFVSAGGRGVWCISALPLTSVPCPCTVS